MFWKFWINFSMDKSFLYISFPESKRFNINPGFFVVSIQNEDFQESSPVLPKQHKCTCSRVSHSNID